MCASSVRETPQVSSAERLVVVVGPTASGKSALAVDLALALGGEVVNADAVQLFRGMDVGSAKVTPEERRGVPHHLLDVLDVDQATSVAAFQRDARAAVEDCLRRVVTPILVGGSSLYVRAVVDDFVFPGTVPRVREKYQRRLETEGPEALHAELRRVAPDAAEHVLPSNGRRLVRALEVTEITGEPFVATLPPYRSIYPDVVLLGLDVPRPVLDERIVRRVDAMWDAGLVQEVRDLLDHGLAEGARAARRRPERRRGARRDRARHACVRPASGPDVPPGPAGRVAAARRRRRPRAGAPRGARRRPGSVGPSDVDWNV